MLSFSLESQIQLWQAEAVLPIQACKGRSESYWRGQWNLIWWQIRVPEFSECQLIAIKKVTGLEAE